MQFMMNARLKPGVGRKDFVKFVQEDKQDWEMVRKGVVSNWLWRTDDTGGIVVLFSAGSTDEAQTMAAQSGLVQSGMLDFEIFPVDPFPSSILAE